ncbi:DUF1127 domain-containing protein [uncultured Methylobacterium sp.]|jgi:hypothetical protein|uniref:DUF1127 domain-containing protein n=1 Tax=uncultured Methylobacterium sp. TaxID=157278 RepID=UPI0026284412|nr:DUF1127 domain-containing protein [uncultured Methylobacterium sp.]
MAPPTPPAFPLPGPPGEPFWRRWLRGRRDRDHLEGLDARLLRDVGLTRADLRWLGAGRANGGPAG